ncbi:hypothetical protein [Gracilibacillus thailandensis]|uniref:Uncharacterized protein n=1 Tax=Gracilibacillus thailandensis TaxID=563735 RepID=A0A6N7R313_9BACI|nr:hypothetical protein [Gracilibacillus thailandensis]MRI66176.1 hypothetical protein [Gracilibacillus thailandensis]
MLKTEEFISPFSYIHHKWKINWELITSNQKYDRPNENRTIQEEKALEAIASVGVIGGLQIKNIFGIGKQQLKSMCDRHLLVRHTIEKNDKEIPIYTIGKYGANHIMPEYEVNYWIEMNTIEVLKCLSFFQFCYLFNDLEIIPTPKPFTAGIRMNNKTYYIYVERNGIKDLMMYLKWKRQFNKRIFLITENLDYVKDIEIFMESDQPLMLRVILDEQLKEREFDIYHYDSSSTEKWIKG